MMKYIIIKIKIKEDYVYFGIQKYTQRQVPKPEYNEDKIYIIGMTLCWSNYLQKKIKKICITSVLKPNI